MTKDIYNSIDTICQELQCIGQRLLCDKVRHHRNLTVADKVIIQEIISKGNVFSIPELAKALNISVSQVERTVSKLTDKLMSELGFNHDQK